MEAVGRKYIEMHDISHDEYNALQRKIYAYATIHTGDELSLRLEHRNYEPWELIQELNSFGLLSCLPYLSYALQINSTQFFPKVDLDPVMWVTSTEVFIELLGDWPEYQNRNSALIMLNAIREKGEVINSFMNSTLIHNAYDQYIYLLNSASEFFNKYIDAYESNTISELTNYVIKNPNKNISPISITNVDLGFFTSDRFHNIFNEGDMGIKSFKIKNVMRGSGPPKEIDVPQFVLQKYLPPEAKCAVWLGGHLSGQYRVWTTSSGGRTKWEYELFLDLHIQFTDQDQENTYRVFWAKKTNNVKSGLRKSKDIPSTFQGHLEETYNRLFSNDESIQDVSGHLAKLQKDMKSTIKNRLKQVSLNIQTTTDDQAANLNLKLAYKGLLQLVWHALVVDNSQEVLTKLEPHFLNKKYMPSDDISTVLIDMSTRMRKLVYSSQITNLCELIEEIATAENQNSPQNNFWFSLNVNKTYNRLLSCISELENGKAWKTNYGKSKKLDLPNT